MHLPGLEWFRAWYGTTDLTPSQYATYSNSPYNYVSLQTSYCPASAANFKEVDTTAPTVVPTWLDTYVNSLVAEGATYHDIGMIWGGRLANPNGMFANNVNADSTKYPSVSRHVIFMTDGIMEPNYTVYSAYGGEYWDNRVAPSGTDSNGLKPYHNNRFLAVCNKVKNMGYTIWMISFGTSLTTEMTTCASAGRAYYAADTTALNNTFKFIAGQVADLRINK